MHKLALVVPVAFLVIACSSKDKDGAAADLETPDPPPAEETPAPPADEPPAEPRAAEKTPPPPAEKSGKIVYGGKTMLVGGNAFLICETVNPAFKGDFNIAVKLDDGTRLKLMGNVDDFSKDHQGLILGSMPSEEKATDLELELDGRTLSGTATTSKGPIEFSFEC